MKYPTCTLSKVVSPGMYCVVSTDQEHVAEVLELETNMKKEMFDGTAAEFELRCQMCVAVTNTDGKLIRGVIEKKLDVDLYQVLLIDYGQVVHVGRSKINVITNKDFMKVEPLAFIVKLYGLIPTRQVFTGTLQKYKACKEWRSESKEFVEKLFKDHHKIVVQNILIEHRTVYGDLFIQQKPNIKFVSLRKLLCKNEFCVYSESHFLKQENLDVSNDDSELERKMELVEKWRKENFGVQKRPFQIHIPPPSSKSGGTDITSLHISSPESASEGTERTSQAGDVPESLPAKSGTLGIGRGKIKLLIAEMKKSKEELGTDPGRPFEGEPRSTSSEPRVSVGRGQFLKKYLELKKCLKAEPGVATGSTTVPEVSLERFSDVEKHRTARINKHRINVLEGVSKMEKATVKPGDFSEFSDSNGLTEVSLSTEDEMPPLVRNVTVEKKFGGSTVLSGDGCRDELNKSDSGKKAKSVVGKLKGNVEETISLPRGILGSSKMDERYKESVWENAASQATMNSCWTPYVRFDDCIVKPAKTFGELRIQPSVIKNLERGGSFGCLSQLQRWTIPAIRKQLNTIAIGSPKTGKTLSYAVPLMDYIQDESYFDELPPGNGPSVVIVASSSRICESIYYLCHSLLGNYNRCDMTRSKVKIVLAHGGGCEEEVWVTLTNGCDVLISTPHCLVRLLEVPILTNLERLTCLVLDEVDIISEMPFRRNVRILLEKARFSTKNRHYQKIFSGERWTPKLESLVRSYMESSALVIGSYAEAVVYEGLKPSVVLVDRNQKRSVLLDRLRGLIGKSKIVIACEETAKATSLSAFLAGEGVSAFLAHEKMMADRLRDVRAAWRSSRDSVLVITDGVLSELNITEAQTLIHYGLPEKSKTNFYLRYFAFENFLRDRQNSAKTEDRGLANKLEDIILVDDENHCQLPHIVDFVVRLGGKVPTKILDRCQEIRRLIEVEKCNSPICGNLLAFGRCRNLKSCPHRHALVKRLDTPDRLPRSGWVNFVVLRTHDASCLSVRLVEHADPSGRASKLSDCHLELSLKLSDFYKSENNRRPHGNAKVGDVCAVRVEIPEGEVFYRAKIIQCLKVDEHDKPLEVGVKLLDQGDVWKRKTIELYELPEEFSEYPATAVDARIVGLQPMDFDVSWSEVANDFTRTLMSQQLEENQFWSGKIVLALNGTLFLEPVKRKQFLSHLNTYVFDMMVRDELLNKRIAVANDEHLPALLKLCSEGGIDVLQPEEIKKEDSAVVQPQWAFLDEAASFIPVRFLAAESTSVVFLQDRNFEKLLRELEEDCQKEGGNTRNGIRAGKVKSLNCAAEAVGTFCLALFEDGKWNRGRIDRENEKEYCVYFVDHGDFLFVDKSDVVPISESLLLRLPCQAIECRLVGLEEEEECPLEVLKEIYAFSEDGRKDLRARVVRKEPKASVTGGRKYTLNLVDEKGVSLNKMLVDCEMVGVKETEKEYLRNMEQDAEESDEEEEEEGSTERDLVEEEGVIVEEDRPDAKLLQEDYIVSFTDDMFQDKVAQEFLKEFASKVFSGSCQEDTREENKENISPVVGSNISSRKRGEPVQNVRKLLELHKKRRRKVKKELELEGRGKILTPQVLWCQNQLEVQMKILLGNVKDYSLECTVSNISFRCFLGDKFYAVDLRLYGAINPLLTKVTTKAFHVLITLSKLAFPLWPRLHVDEGRLRWINLDVESLTEKKDIFSDKIRSAKLEIESGALKKGVREERILPCSDSEDSDACEVSSDSGEGEGEYTIL